MKPINRTYVCHYCKEYCELNYLINELTYTGYFSNYSEEVWICHNCPIKVRYLIDETDLDSYICEVITVCFAVSHNDEKYSIRITYPSQICTIYHVSIGEKSFNQTELTRFQSNGEINPSNAQQKLTTILTFL